MSTQTTTCPLARLTENHHGLTFPLSKYGKMFVDFAHKAPGPMLDIGAAYGVCTIPALRAGADVIANDISTSALTRLEQNTPEDLRAHLTLLPGHFPDGLNFKPNSLGAIEASHVLHFLDGPTLEMGCRKMYEWLKSGGRVFVVCFTPYHRFMQRFIPVYEDRVLRGERWPGYVEDSTPYVLKQGIIPRQTHLMDPAVLSRAFRDAGFVVEDASVFPCPPDLEPREFFHLDGREWVGLSARKP